MVVYENPFIRMDYDPTTDILSARMPDVDVVVLPEIRRLLSIIVEQVRNYHVKSLLIDATTTEVSVDEETYTSMMMGFLRDLQTTRLQRLARIISASVIRENVVKKVVGGNSLPIQLQSFTDIQAAKEWLAE